MKRQLHLDVLRIISCFLVIANHTNINLYFLDNSATLTRTWVASFSYSVIYQAAVPLFLMISGSVLLGKDESYRKLFRRIARVAGILFVFSGFYFFLWSRGAYDSFWPRFRDMFIQIITSKATTAFGYLYIYLGILVTLPMLRKMIRHFERKDYLYYALWSVLIVGGIQVINQFIPIVQLNPVFEVPMFANGYFAYFVIGYYINTFITPTKKLTCAALIYFLFMFVFLIIACSYEHLLTGATVGFKLLKNYFDIHVFIFNVAIFYLAKALFESVKFSEKFAKVISTAGMCTFGIYLISDYLIAKYRFIYDYFSTFTNPLIGIVMWGIVVFIVGFVIVYLVRKIPFIAKYI